MPMKIFLIIFLNSFLNIGSLRSENLQKSFINQESASWEKAQFERVSNHSNGKSSLQRYFLDKDGNIYKFTKTFLYTKGPSMIGNLNETKRETGKSYFGATLTTTQYSVEGKKLFEFSKTRYQDGTESKVKRTFLGGPISEISLKKLNEDKKKYSKVLIEQGNKDLNNQYYADAITTFNRAIDLDPQSYEAYFGRGIGKFMTLKLTEAYEDYSKSLQIKPHRGTYQFRAFSLIKILNTSNDEFKKENNYKYMRKACNDFKESYKLGMQRSGELLKSNNCSQYGVNIDS